MSAAVVVRCPSCKQLSRVAEQAVGHVVACPRCQFQFLASPADRSAPSPPPPHRFAGDDIPVIQPRRIAPPRRPTAPAPATDDDPPVVHPHAPTGLPVALALAPLGVPLLWLVVSLVSKWPSPFSFAAPVAVGLGVCGLGFGLAFADRWSVRARTRGLVALAALAYLAAAGLYFTRLEWLEAARVVVSRTGAEWTWKKFQPDDRTFEVKFPGDPLPTTTPLPGWNAEAVRFADPKGGDVYAAAYGVPPADLAGKLADDAWFAKVRQALTEATAAEVVREQPRPVKGGEAREYELKLPNAVTAKRVVRVVRSAAADRRMYYLAVEGPSLTADAPDVRHFFDTFALTPPKK